MYSTYQSREYLQTCKVTNLSTLSFLNNCSLRNTKSYSAHKWKLSKFSSKALKKQSRLISQKFSLDLFGGLCVCVNVPELTIYKLIPTVTFYALIFSINPIKIAYVTW